MNTTLQIITSLANIAFFWIIILWMRNLQAQIKSLREWMEVMQESVGLRRKGTSIQ